MPSETGLLSLARGPDYAPRPEENYPDYHRRSKENEEVEMRRPKDDQELAKEEFSTTADYPGVLESNDSCGNYSQDALSALIATLGQQRAGRDTPDLCHSNHTNTVTWPAQVRYT